MLKTLRIRNLATIEDLRLDPGDGLNVLTGETGAGKSIVVDALGLALGARGDTGLVRSGTDRAVIEAAFAAGDAAALARTLDDLGIDAGEGELIVRREVASTGTGRVLINGSPSTVAALRAIGEHLVDLHGQNEQQGLLSPDRHLELLDVYGKHAALLDGVASAYASVLAARERSTRLAQLGREAAARESTLRETIREIRGVAPREGELDALLRDRSLLQNGARVVELLEDAIERLDQGDGSAVARVHACERRVSDLASIDPSLGELAQRLASARLELQDARDTLQTYRERFDFDPSRLDAMETRRAALEHLLLKWGPDEADALAAAAAAEAELATLQNLESEVAEAEAATARAMAAYTAAAAALTKKRHDAARRLGPAVQAELAPLALPKARFAVAFAPRGGEHPKGAERAEFLLAANPGEAARALGRAASGGELSRVMLALHVVLDTAGDRRALVFDEVDAGVSGAVALAVGARLAGLARRHQVLCVTHLPQVAAHANGHYHVHKRVEGGRTHTGIEVLAGEARVEALARMLGGRQATTASRENAAELLAEAGQASRPRGGR